ncbi:MAG: UDP-N-acetylmuramate dehydrogenase [Opitutaceae bacterium]|nr:UDP-N-acetylmuramate dehydrogenase [Opitutaceae bacterium]
MIAKEKLIEKRAHLIGVGGMGMAPLAIYLSEFGYSVSGEDKGISVEIRNLLSTRDISLTNGGSIDADVDILVVSSAISLEHPRVVEAKRRGLPVLLRGEMLAKILREKRLIAVVGSHGKTTTCAMLVTALRSGGMDVGYLLGGLFNDGSVPPSRCASSDWVVAEIDESDGTIEGFSPEITLCVNLDWDHCDQYPEEQMLAEMFHRLKERTSGAFFYNNDCARSSQVFGNKEGSDDFSFGKEGAYTLVNYIEDERGMVLTLGGSFEETQAKVCASGEFNAQNACAALAVSSYLGLSVEDDLLGDYSGVCRRQSLLFSSPFLTVLEDYAHHPTEIKALLESVRQRYKGRLVVCFQPHRYSRTVQFKREFAEVLIQCDYLFLFDVYPASESYLEGGETKDIKVILDDLASDLPVELLSLSDGVGTVLKEVKDGDVLLFVGAGDIDRLAQSVLKKMGEGDSRRSRRVNFFASLERTLSNETVVKVEEPLASKTTLRVGGEAMLYAEPASVDDLRSLLVASRSSSLPVFLLGRGSNLIVPDEGVSGLVLRLHHSSWRQIQPQKNGCVWVGAGVRLKELCGYAYRENERGFEFLEGIPGTVGGALRMNAGAMGGWMYDLVEEIQIMAPSGEIRLMKRDDLHVEYRRCDEVVEGIALGVLLRPAVKEESFSIRQNVERMQKQRHESQPREPSAGCIFKNPPEESAGKIIDELGLKGARVGKAEISSAHANFIINRGGATSADVIALVRKVRDRVRKDRSIELEPEVLLYGKEWRKVL